MMPNPVLLYIEDDPLSRQVMHMLLTRGMGMTQVSIFENSESVIDKLVALPEPPDLILLDIHMKPHNGFEVLEMLRADERFQSAKVVAVTASVMNEEVKLLQTAGFDGALAKPIDPESCPTFIQRILNGQRVWQIT